ATAGGSTVAGALAAAVLGTTNRLGATRTGRATGVAQARVMGGITDTLHGCWRISSEDRITELSTGAVASKDTPREQRSQDHSGQVPPMRRRAWRREVEVARALVNSSNFDGSISVRSFLGERVVHHGVRSAPGAR